MSVIIYKEHKAVTSFRELSAVRWHAACIVLMSSISIFWWFYCYQPLLTQLKQYEIERINLAQQNAVLEKKILKTDEAQTNSLDFEALQKKIVTYRSSHEITTTIMQLFQTHQLFIKSFKLLSSFVQETLTTLNYSVECEGSFINFKNMCDQLKNYFYFCSVETLLLKKIEDENRLLITFTFSVLVKKNEQ